MIDRIMMYLSRAHEEFELLPKDKWEPRHQYLNATAQTARYRHDKPEYMPAICAFTDNSEISRIQWQACPPKVLYGHNLQEITPNELDEFLDKSVAQLRYAGVLTDKDILHKHYVSGLDVNKLVIYPGKINIASKILRDTPKKGRFKKGMSFYPDGGATVYNELKCRKLNCYDKTTQSHCLEYAPAGLVTLVQNAPFTVLNLEYHIQGKDEIDAEFATQGITLPNTLETAFNPIVAQTILLNRVSSWFEQIFTVDSSSPALINAIRTYCKQEGISGAQTKSALLGAALAVSYLGLNEFQNFLLEDSDRQTVMKFLKHIREVHLPCLPEEQILKTVVFSALENMEPVTIEILQQVNESMKPRFSPPQSGCNTRMPTVPLLEWQGGIQ